MEDMDGIQLVLLVKLKPYRFLLGGIVQGAPLRIAKLARRMLLALSSVLSVSRITSMIKTRRSVRNVLTPA